MQVKTNIWDIFKGADGKWSIRAILAFITCIAFWSAGLLDATTPGVSVDSEFYWACVVLILGLIVTRALQYIAQIRGSKIIEESKQDIP